MLERGLVLEVTAMFAEDRLRQSVVHIQGALHGTGFFVDHDGSLLTCFHVVASKETNQSTGQEITVTFGDRTYLAECIFSSPDPEMLDVAVLRLVDGRLPDKAVLAPLGTWQSLPNQINTFRSFGFRSLDKFKGMFAEGEIRGRIFTDMGVELLQLESEAVGAEEIRQGMSGAPVYHENTHQIVGMITLRVKKEGETIPCAIPIEEIADIWYPIKYRLHEEEVLKQLLKVIRIGDWFTEKSMRAFYDMLPIPGKIKYDDLPEDKPLALIEQLRVRGVLRDFISFLRWKRPEIPLNELIEFPSIQRINFVNREEDLKEAGNRYAPPDILFEAPAGYGKTELLKAVEQQHFQDNWLCLYVETADDTASAADLARQLYAKAGHAIIFPPQSYDLGFVGRLLAGMLKDRVTNFGFSGVVLLVDSVERLPDGEIDGFLNQFLVNMKDVLKDTPQKMRVRLAGRYNGATWSRVAKFPLKVMQLTPFAFRYVLDTVQSLFPSQKELELRSAYLMHLTHGHPGCMAQILRRVDFSQPVDLHFKINQKRYQEIVLPVVRNIHLAIPGTLRDIFDILSVFRRYNYRLLTRMMEIGLINYSGSADSLEKELTATYLVKRKDGFIKDEIVRGLLAIRLRWEEPDRFIRLCEQATMVYEQDLSQSVSRTEFIVVESLYQNLQLHYYQGDGSISAREALHASFFAENGILNRYIKSLADRPDAPDVRANLRTLLEHDDWEFQFFVNFFLRQDTFDNKPYELMLERIEYFFEN